MITENRIDVADTHTEQAERGQSWVELARLQEDAGKTSVGHATLENLILLHINARQQRRQTRCAARTCQSRAVYQCVAIVERTHAPGYDGI